MKRYFILHGDTTTDNGTVIALNDSATSHGRAIALIGDKVICPKCNTTGYIVPTGPRLSCIFDSREVALDGDLCMCACERKPRLINSRDDMSQSMEYEELIAQGFGEWVGATSGAAQKVASCFFDDKFILRESGGKPLINVAYAVKRKTGDFEYGETDDGGRTHLLSTVAAVENINFYFAG